MASMPSTFEIVLNSESLDALKRASDVLERQSAAELAFGYLLANTPCTCLKKSDRLNHMHDNHCVITIAIDIHDGRRPWPTNDR